MNFFKKTGWQAVLGILFPVLWLLTAGTGVRAQEISPSEYQVKAAFLYNFGKFVTWPTNAFTQADAPLIIGVFGSNPFQDDLERIVAGKKIEGHPVIVRLIKTTAAAKTCHILFISTAEQTNAGNLAVTLRGCPVLTVTENAPEFKASGWTINFVVEENKIRFEINDQAATQAGLMISSKLLSLAQPMEKLGL